MCDDERKNDPQNNKKYSADDRNEKSTQCNEQECGSDNKSDHAHHDIHENVRKEILSMRQNIRLLFLKPLPRREPRHEHLRNREKMIDEPEIIPPDMKNIRERITVMPYQIIPDDRKDTHEHSIAGKK
jgi:hypothetical protein